MPKSKDKEEKHSETEEKKSESEPESTSSGSQKGSKKASKKSAKGSKSSKGSKKKSSKKASKEGKEAKEGDSSKRKGGISRRRKAAARVKRAQQRTDLIIATKRHGRILTWAARSKQFPQHTQMVKVTGSKAKVSGPKTPYHFAKKAVLTHQGALEATMYQFLAPGPDSMRLRFRKNPDAKDEDMGTDEQFRYAHKFMLCDFAKCLSEHFQRPRMTDEPLKQYIERMLAQA